jgi:peptide-methionine (R)-S-oxide reductase
MKYIAFFVVALAIVAGCMGMWSPQSGNARIDQSSSKGTIDYSGRPKSPRLHTSNEEWKKVLTSNQYFVLREAGTEPRFHNALDANFADGDYYCAACGQKLFTSKTKFDSGTGWPSFWAPASKDAVLYRKDTSDFAPRIEVLCSKCGGHLGHVFSDGPKPTGQRFCMNSAALKFVPRKK